MGRPGWWIMNDQPSIDAGKLSALLTQTEAMLTIQRSKHDALAADLQHYQPDGRSAGTLATQLGHLGNEIMILDNVAQQLRAAGVIPK
jgi:cation transport regulator ChaC